MKAKIKFDLINNVFILGYKLIGVVLLSICALAILMYACLFLFYMSSRTWATPIVLSPSQEKVLTLQPQIIALESGLDTQKIAFNTSETTKTALGFQIRQIENILSRTDKAMLVESNQLAKNSKDLNVILVDKKNDIRKTKEIISNC